MSRAFIAASADQLVLFIRLFLFVPFKSKHINDLFLVFFQIFCHDIVFQTIMDRFVNSLINGQVLLSVEFVRKYSPIR